MKNWCYECVGEAEQCVLRWFEHMERREEDQLAKRILLGYDVEDCEEGQELDG